MNSPSDKTRKGHKWKWFMSWQKRIVGQERLFLPVLVNGVFDLHWQLCVGDLGTEEGKNGIG